MSLEPPALSEQAYQIPSRLEEIISRCLRKKKEERYSSARELRDELEKLRAARSRSRFPAKQRAAGEGAASVIPRPLARLSLILLQLLYLGLYCFALFFHRDVFLAIARGLAVLQQAELMSGPVSSRLWTSVFLVTACCGIAVRLYLLASVGFDDPKTGRQFRRLFPFLLLLDEIWALSPLLLIGKWRDGITLVCMVVLAYLPISHRNLIYSAYEVGDGE